MANAHQLRRLIAYNQWADERILTAIEGLSPEELERPRDSYFGSIASNLRHTVMAQVRWLARWKGEALPAADQALGPWRQVFAASHAALAQYLGPLADTDCDRIVKYTLASGVAREQPLGQLITHLVNHGTHHRAETGLLLERDGRSPGDLDYIVFLHERS